MKKISFIFILSLFSLFLNAQISKTEVETMIKSADMSSLPDVFLIRTREHDGASQGWFEKFEKLDPKTMKIFYGEKSLILEGNSYSALIPYDKIKLIFYKKGTYLSIELID